MHHGNPPEPHQQPDVVQKVREAMKAIGEPLGATGAMPEGKICEHDEGEIRLAVGVDQKNKLVVIDFGKPVAFVAFTPQQARAIAEMLRKRSYEAQRK